MLRRGLVFLTLAAAALGAPPPGAHAVAPGEGPAFGTHVAEMAPAHPKAHGAMFGECVSTMAQTGSCPHHAP